MVENLLIYKTMRKHQHPQIRLWYDFKAGIKNVSPLQGEVGHWVVYFTSSKKFCNNVFLFVGS